MHDEVGHLLHDDHHSGRLLAVGGVDPDQTEEVEHYPDLLVQLLELTLLHFLKVASQRLQVHAGGTGMGH